MKIVIALLIATGFTWSASAAVLDCRSITSEQSAIDFIKLSKESTDNELELAENFAAQCYGQAKILTITSSEMQNDKDSKQLSSGVMKALEGMSFFSELSKK